MHAGFRSAMGWLHTGGGVLMGGLLFVVFWMGTLCVFDREIDRWMMPGTRLPAPPAEVSLDRTVVPVAAVLAAGRAQWRVTLPNTRVPYLRLFFRAPGGAFVVRAIDPASGRLIADQGTLGASGFLVDFHSHLRLSWRNMGYWLVGLAGLAMLLLLVSGVAMHRRLFADFFTFRPKRNRQRATLDLHHLTGVLALPFHALIVFTGLVVFMGIYFPQAHEGVYGPGANAQSQYIAEAYGRYMRPKSGVPAALGSLDAMLAEAGRQWPGQRVDFVRVQHAGDAHGFVELNRGFADAVEKNIDQLYLDAATGAVLHRFEAAPVMRVQRFFTGVHLVQFQQGPLRGMYFLAGLSGCVLIATGLLLWLGARRTQHAREGRHGVRVVEGLAVGSTTGVIAATLVFLAANRLLPPGFDAGGLGRATWEVAAFHAAWGALFVHAALRAERAWRDQAWVIAMLALLCVLLNAVTTGDHLLQSFWSGQWAVAGVDTVLLASGLLAAGIARRLGRVPDPAGAHS